MRSSTQTFEEEEANTTTTTSELELNWIVNWNWMELEKFWVELNGIEHFSKDCELNWNWITEISKWIGIELSCRFEVAELNGIELGY